jgi:hypothetical protein
MSILIYAECRRKFKKVAFELLMLKKVAETLGTTVTAVTM